MDPLNDPLRAEYEQWLAKLAMGFDAAGFEVIALYGQEMQKRIAELEHQLKDLREYKWLYEDLCK